MEVRGEEKSKKGEKKLREGRYLRHSERSHILVYTEILSPINR